MTLVADVASGGRDFLVRCDAHADYPSGYVRGAVERLAALGPETAVLATVMDTHGATPFQRAAASAADTPSSAPAARRTGAGGGRVGRPRPPRALPARRFRASAATTRASATTRTPSWTCACARPAAASGSTADAGHLPEARHPGALARQYFSYGKGRARTVLKHRARPRLRQLAPVLNLVLLGACVLAAPLQPASLLLPAGYLGLLAGASLWTATRRRSATGLWVGPALAAMHLPWGAGFVATTNRLYRPQ